MTSPARRLVFQSLVTLIFVFSLDVQIFSTRVIFLDHILSYYIPSLIFTSFCLIILMNGTNFIDGLNGLVIGYYLIVLLILFKLGLLNDLFINNSELQFFVYFLFILFLLNIKNKLYLGDSGSYLLSFFIGYILILIYNGNLIFSPFFIVLLLWYPCFENLFSIIRKFRLKKSPVKPDNRHFHHLLFLFLKRKMKSKNNIINNYSSFIINFYNLIIFYFASLNIYSSQYLIILVLLNIIIYVVVYLKLVDFLFKSKI